MQVYSDGDKVRAKLTVAEAGKLREAKQILTVLSKVGLRYEGLADQLGCLVDRIGEDNVITELEDE